MFPSGSDIFGGCEEPLEDLEIVPLPMRVTLFCEKGEAYRW